MAEHGKNGWLREVPTGVLVPLVSAAVVIALVLVGTIVHAVVSSSRESSAASAPSTSSAAPAPELSPAEAKYLSTIGQNIALPDQDRSVWLQAGETACSEGGSVDPLVSELINSYGPVLAAPFRSQEPNDYSAGVVGADLAIRTAETTLCPPS